MPPKLLQYDILEQIGEGAKSKIYVGKDPSTGRMVALKHVLREDTKDIRFVDQMETEYQISKQFNHPNLRRTLALKINKSLLMKVTEAVMVMEYVTGRPLEVSLPRGDLDQILDVFIQAAEGLKYMHGLGIVHCDVKPNNILRDSEGRVKVIDYGQSCKVGTIKHRIQGTPDFIAPEQVARKSVSPQTDIFNLGATLYWAVTGTNIPTLYTTSRKGQNSLLSDALFKSPRELNPKVPSVVSNMVMTSVSTNRSKRPQDMDMFIQKLEIGRHMLGRQNPAA